MMLLAERNHTNISEMLRMAIRVGAIEGWLGYDDDVRRELEQEGYPPWA